MPWISGTYSRGYPSWSADAASNLPISATKFDTEDNDFAAGLNNCLTIDGLNKPNTAMTWSLASAPALTINRSTTGGTAFAVGFTGGTNNPSLQFQISDGGGATLNLTTAQTIALAIQGTNVVAITSAAFQVVPAGTAALPSLSLNGTNTGLYSPTAGEIGFSASGVAAGLVNTAGAWSIPQPSSAAVTLTLTNAGGSAAASPLAIVTGSAGYGATFSDGTNTGGFLGFDGSHNFNFGSSGAFGAEISTNGSVRLTISSGGAVAVDAPSASTTTAFTVNGIASTTNYAMKLIAPNTAGQSLGLQIVGGTTAADTPLAVYQAGGVQQLLYLYGDGGVVVGGATGGDQGLGSINASSIYIAGAQLYIGSPINQQNTTYACVLADANKTIYGAGTTSTITIPSNASVPYPKGTMLSFFNRGGGTMTIQITSDTLLLMPSASTGSRTLAANASSATALKVDSTVWMISGVGIT